MKKNYLTESSFTKLFYEIILRMNFSVFTPNIYKCFENCLLFVNCHLKSIEVNQFGQIKILPGKRLSGFEAIIHINVCSKDKEVKMQSRKLIFSLAKAELENGKQIDKLAFEDIIQPCCDIIAKEYSELALNLDKIVIISDTFELVKDTINFLNGGKNMRSIDGVTPISISSKEDFSKIKLTIENNVSQFHPDAHHQEQNLRNRDL